MVSTRPPKWLIVALGLFGLVLLASSIPGAFLIDECHYLVTVTGLSQGSLSVPGTEGLKPNPELFYFDPVAKGRRDFSMPAASTAPALYAPLALPFSLFGWRGLVAMNILAYLLCALLVFHYSARHATTIRTPYLATATFMFGTYCLDYAQGLWPHMLSMTLVMGALVLSDLARSGGPKRWATLAGLSGGVATGIRYQNLIYAGFTGLSMLIWAPNPVSTGTHYGLGVLGPLLVSAVMNRLRNGWWNPVSKGPYYLNSLGRQASRAHPLQPVRVLWAKLFDFTYHKPVQFMVREPGIGAFLLHRALKRALIQSCPWALTSMAAMAASWRRRAIPMVGQRELRVMTLLIVPLLLVFALAGWKRTDGFCFNQRYFIDLLPMLAVALAWAADRAPLPRRHLVAGALLGANGVLALYLLDYREPLRHVGLLYIPLFLAGGLVISWLMAHRKPRWLFSLLLGACLAWAGVVHLGEDIPGTRKVRERKTWVANAVDQALPPGEPVGVLAHFPLSVNLCSLHLKHDIVIGDTNLDGGIRGRRLTTEFLEKGRRVFMVMDKFYPEKLRQRLLKDRPHQVVHRAKSLEVIEITR